MMTKHTFKNRLFIYYSVVFMVFALLIVSYQFKREKTYKSQQLENTLDNITEITHRYIDANNIIESREYNKIDSLLQLVPLSGTRLTLINPNGHVLYDSFVTNPSTMENHLMRPELQKSLYSNKGSNIRSSTTTGEPYYYYARFYNTYFIRSAVVYDLEIKKFLRAESLFFVYMAIFFFVVWMLLAFVTRRFGEAVTRLKDFAIKVGRGEAFETHTRFPHNELGDIGQQIIQIYNKQKSAKDELSVEREKLFSHLFVLNEGVGFFSPDKKKILTNNHFIQYINTICDQSTISAEYLFESEAFLPINNFLAQTLKAHNEINPNELPRKEFALEKQGRYFSIQCVIFQDMSFEIVITDISKHEKRRLLKQQMTSNIAHELKTPVASVKGFLETILNNPDMEPEQQLNFTGKALMQANRLTSLINDLVVLNKIEEAREHFKVDQILVKSVLDEVLESFQDDIQKKNAKISIHLNPQIIVQGSKSLLFSIFQNLIENALAYAGENINITISQYLEDENNYYFSVADDGKGIPEAHLSRIFERFYRVDSGRSRKLGGTGLGLAIVKNAILLQKGDISVRNRQNGGVEFLFSLPRA